ncbi:hypothetical protein NDU88_001106 [Pleurodeles waltl]|uniref:Uncharacterized protein n=1 Tax=Pleurodeles waltl TaxID=8319 RepID=A0AAV7R7M0_PLEWA|nr:hypothetical protein NDU88_001106 [Pleurodeles waltl]
MEVGGRPERLWERAALLVHQPNHAQSRRRQAPGPGRGRRLERGLLTDQTAAAADGEACTRWPVRRGARPGGVKERGPETLDTLEALEETGWGLRACGGDLNPAVDSRWAAVSWSEGPEWCRYGLKAGSPLGETPCARPI